MYSSVVVRLAPLAVLLPACVVTVHDKPANSAPEPSEAQSKNDDSSGTTKGGTATPPDQAESDANANADGSASSNDTDSSQAENPDAKPDKKPRKLIKMRQTGQGEPAAQGGGAEADPPANDPGLDNAGPDNAGQSNAAGATDSGSQ